MSNTETRTSRRWVVSAISLCQR